MRVANGLCVLIVEDDAVFAMALRDSCAEAGHSVTWATDGEQGLRVFASAPFDAVITDLSMPKLDGYQMIRQLRTEWPCLPVVVVTGDTSIADILHVHEHDPGPMILLHKPVQETVIVDALEQIFAAEVAG